MSYVDGFVIPVPKKKVAAYLKMAREAASIWEEYGALEYRECVADDIKPHKDMGMGPGFAKLAGCKPTETVVFSWVVYKNKAHRDRVNKKIMKDPRLAEMMANREMPFDPKRMAYGGFKVGVEF